MYVRGTFKYVFENIPKGYYTISAFHDINNNDILLFMEFLKRNRSFK
ncbi:hypothetical protein DID80_03040 [Candidatus Marinamargulisbacteria bacterium SCGC AAA071-K20]|nr:hypothetical protein DID80_03040 [Candidatus Marinamargulisbacteria bacterium SCGC AAA071-K20]